MRKRKYSTKTKIKNKKYGNVLKKWTKHQKNAGTIHTEINMDQ